MKVAFIGTYGLWTPHLETELEIADKHLAEGDEVHFIACDGAVDACDSNPTKSRKQCARCTWKLEAGLRVLSSPVTRRSLGDFLRAEDRAKVARLPREFADRDEAFEFEFEGFDAGIAALSSAIWEIRDDNYERARKNLAAYLRAGVQAFLATRRLLAQESFDRVYVFNGRMAPKRGVQRAARAAGVDCVIHERGKDIHHYSLYENCLLHDIGATVDRIHELWRSNPLSEGEKKAAAHDWYERRRGGEMGSWVSYTEEQRAGALPKGWDPTKRNVAFYTMTEYEFAAIGKEWLSPLYAGPTDAAVDIAHRLSERGDVHLTIRVHPNPSGRDSASVRRVLDIDLPNVTIVEPESEVSTYALMEAADVVVTSGSTAGIEAAYWGTPCVLSGRSLYFGLGAGYEPETREEMFALIAREDLPPNDRLPAEMYGFYQTNLGIPYENFAPDGLFGGQYRGTRLRPTWVQRRAAGALSLLDRFAPR